MEIGTAPNPNVFIGTDPDDVVPIPVGKAVFYIGAMPAFQWEKLISRQMVSHQSARRRTIRKMHEEGLDPEELISEGSPLTKADLEISVDPEHREEFSKVMLEAARWSLRKWEGFVRRDGSAFEIGHRPVMVDGDAYQVLDDKTVGILRVNQRILQLLWLGIRHINEMGVEGKKA